MQLHCDQSLLTASEYLAEAVNLAYDLDKPKGHRWSWSHGLTCGDAQARLLIAEDTGAGVIAIAGTQMGVGDWSSNLQVTPKTIGGAYTVHTGFAKSAESIMKAILAEPKLPECFAEGKYFITGHSLGAATAALLPVLFDIAGDHRVDMPRGVVGFGSPKYILGDAAFLWPCELLHIQSTLDLVSHVPTGFFIREWARAGQQVYVNDRGFSAYPGQQIKRIISYAYLLTKMNWMRGSVRGIKEHSMHLYETRVKNALTLLRERQEKLGD